MKFRSNNCVAIDLPDLKKAEAFYSGVMNFRLLGKTSSQLEYDTGRFVLYINKHDLLFDYNNSHNDKHFVLYIHEHDFHFDHNNSHDFDDNIYNNTNNIEYVDHDLHDNLYYDDDADGLCSGSDGENGVHSLATRRKQSLHPSGAI